MADVKVQDVKDMETYLDAISKKNYFVNSGDFISYEILIELVRLSKKFYKTNFSNCIRGAENSKPTSYEVENCCKDCEEIEQEKKKQEEITHNENYEAKRFQEVKEFIKTYLNPNMVWNKKVTPCKKIRILQSKLPIRHSEVSSYIKTMSYQDFLQTLYWKGISDYKKMKADYRCELCNSTGVLNVHHRCYSIHGDELYSLNDLIVLCQDCHRTFHHK